MTELLPLDQELADALIISATNVFKTALIVNVEPQAWSLIDTPLRGDYSGSIYMVDMNNKEHVAIMSLSFMDPVIRHVLQTIYGSSMNERNIETKMKLKDGISEITNIIYTGVKSILNNNGHSFVLSLPIIIEGKDHVIKKNTNNKSLRIPFLTSDYEFFIDACIDIAPINLSEILPTIWNVKASMDDK